MTMKLSTAIQKAFEYGLLHVILVASSYYYFGLLKGIIALVILYQAVKFTGKKFGYDICVGNDVIHIPEKVKFDEIKEKMYSTVIHHIKRYRQIPVNYLGFYFWKEVDKNIAKNQIKICEAEIKSKDDILQYTQKLLGTKLDRDKPQWELIYIENFTEATSLCFFKFHHSFTDGAGVINSMMFLNSTDRISQEMFKGRGLPFYIKFLNGLLYPICLLICSFELWKHNWKGHDMIQTKSGENSGESICILSKTYKLNDIKRCYKRFDKTTMNNFMMGLAAKSIHRWYQLNGVEEPKDISTIIPVVMKPFSPNIDELNNNLILKKNGNNIG